MLPVAEITVSPEERSAGALAHERRSFALLLLHCSGYVVLRHALAPALVERVRDAHAALLEECRDSARRRGIDVTGSSKLAFSDATETAYFIRCGRWSLFPRLEAPFDDVALFANPIALSLVRPLLGEGLYCKFTAITSCWRGSRLQAPHREVDFRGLPRPRGYLVHAPLVHCDLQNGPMEVFPGGSHLWSVPILKRHGVDPFVFDERNDAMDRLVAYLPSRKLVIGPGDVLIRDQAMLHRGTANETDAPRPILCSGYFRRDYHEPYGDPRLNLDEGMFERLPSTVGDLFAYAFRPRSMAALRYRRAELEWKAERRIETLWKRFGTRARGARYG